MPKKLLFTEEHAPGCTIIVDLKPNSGDKVRETMDKFFKNPMTPVAIEAVNSIQYARWILYDNDTKFLYTVIFDGDFDKYWVDFLPWFKKGNAIPVFQHAVDWPANAMDSVEVFVKYMRDHQADSLGEWGSFGGATRLEIMKALRVNQAFQKVLDNPAAAKALQDTALKPLLAVASD